MGEVDLLVFGAGSLGTRVARLWRAQHKDARIVCVTRTPRRHEQLRAEGFEVALTDAYIGADAPAKFPYVLCSIPPNGSFNQCAAEVARAKSLATQRFVQTSSTGVYDSNATELLTEASPVAETARAKRLLAGEASAGTDGIVLRLGMLYTREEGAYTYWVRAGAVSSGPESMFNSIHYDDAAALCMKALTSAASTRGVFLGVDNSPRSAGQICTEALKHPMFKSFGMPKFGSGGYTKRISNSQTQQKLDWTPQYGSFDNFVEIDSKRFLDEQ